MNTTHSRTHRPTYYTAKEAAWILGANPSVVCRAIRTGALPTVRRRSQLVVPSSALHRLLRGGAP